MFIHHLCFSTLLQVICGPLEQERLDIGLNWELPRRIAFTLVVAGLRVKMFHYFPYQGFLPVHNEKLSRIHN
jgi:hypothetical protein